MNIVGVDSKFHEAQNSFPKSPEKKKKRRPLPGIQQASALERSATTKLSSFSDLYWSTPVEFKKRRGDKVRVNIPGYSNLWNPISSPEVHHGGDQAPFLFRKVKGDFQVWVKVTGNFTNPGDQAGILVKESSKVYMRCGLERKSASEKLSSSVNSNNDDELHCAASTVVARKDSWDKSSCIGASAALSRQQQKGNETMRWFSMKRRGNAIAAYCSDDGKVYKPIRTSYLSDKVGLMVGVYGACPLSEAGIRVCFSEFKIKELSALTTTNHGSRRKVSFETSSRPQIQYTNQPDRPRLTHRTSFRYYANNNDFDDDEYCYSREFDDSDSEDEEKKKFCFSDDDDYYYGQKKAKNSTKISVTS